MSQNSPIGVFDSGLGGLTVLTELIGSLPHEDFIYLGDTARIPYGAKSASTLQKYAQQNVDFLKAQGAKAVVIACNSASTVLGELTSSLPIMGVIEPGSEAAAAATRNKKIGIIGTRTTISKKSYVTEIAALDPEIQVFQQACPLLVPLVEEGWDNDPITNLIVYRYISPLLASDIDTLVLGCTHYPILLNSIQKVTGSNINIISSGESVAKKVSSQLKAQSLLKESSEPGQLRLLTTDDSDTYKSLASRLLTHLPHSGVELVEL